MRRSIIVFHHQDESDHIAGGRRSHVPKRMRLSEKVPECVLIVIFAVSKAADVQAQ
jgi:hypothetical protein